MFKKQCRICDYILLIQMFQAYKQLVEKDMVGKDKGDNVIGCGSIQWTLKGRYEKLMQCYEEADRKGNNDGQLSYEECVIAETNCMLKELSVDEPGYNFNTRVVERCGTNNSVEDSRNAAKVICDIYENPNEKAKRTDERQQAAEDVYRVMMNS